MAKKAAPDPAPDPSLGDLPYVDAISELDQILDRLERDDPDVDQIATDVARAAALIAHCRSRITDTRLQVDEVLGSIEDGEG
ncbi:MAG: exodeoxyribonuclease VII small subunit [Acidimicrobiales bacterium]|nr:exodeoxyribonuclease VII small subunit [Acidimicrobiales bacterium]